MIKEMYEEYLALGEEINALWKEFHQISPKDTERLQAAHKKITDLNTKKDSLQSKLYGELSGKCLKLDDNTCLICYSDDGFGTFEEVELITE